MRSPRAWPRFRALMEEKRTHVVVWGGVGCFLLLSFLAVVGDGGFLEVYKFNRHLGRLEMQIRTLEQENRRLHADMLSLQNDPYQMEKLAREELGLAHQDELIFEILAPQKSPK